MPKRIEKDLEELSVNMFVNEYGSLRAVYNRLYAIIHLYYSGRRQLAVSEETISLEKLLQMRKDIATRLERINILTNDQQFPQENFEDFAKEKLNKMRLAIGLIETASLVGELGTYSKTIMDYMKSCCASATKFITILSDPGNQSLKDVENNLATFLKQIDALIRQRRSSSDLPGISHKEYLSVSGAEKTTAPLDEALNILEKIDFFKSKSKPLAADVSSSETCDAKGTVAALGEEEVQQHSTDPSGSHKFQDLLDEKYGFRSRPEP